MLQSLNATAVQDVSSKWSCTCLSLLGLKNQILCDPHLLVPLTGFLQASSSFDVRDSTGKVCIIANLTVAFSVEYKSNGQKQVMGGISLLVLCILYHVWGLFVSVHY